MRFAIFNHQDKARAYIDALSDYAGVDVIQSQHVIPEVDFVLTDHDLYGRVPAMERLRDLGAQHFFLYPHSGRPNTVNDVLPGWVHTTAHFVVSEVHKQVMEAYGYPKPIHVVGWHLCPPRQFQEREQVRKVLFAPIHPRCAPVDQAINLAAFERLRRLAEKGEIVLTVRFINDLEKSGLPHVEHGNIRYVQGDLKPDYHQIDQTDVVVAHQTFLYMAVARGIPAVGLGTDIPTHLVPMGQHPQYARNWNDYVDLLAFPLDILEEADTLGLLQRAIKVEPVVGRWRERMIGKPFDGARVREVIREHVVGSRE